MRSKDGCTSPYEVCPEGIHPCNMKNKDVLKKIQEALYIGWWGLSPLPSKHLGTSHSSPNCHHQYDRDFTLSCFPESHWQSEISSLSKVILVLGKARSHRVPNLGCSGAESPEWLDVSPKNSPQDMMHEQARCCDEAANHYLSIAMASESSE